MKKTDALLREYVKILSEDQLRWLNTRYTQALFGDRAEITECLSTDRELDKWLQSANGADELFNLLDQMGEFVKKEAKKRLSNDDKD